MTTRIVDVLEIIDIDVNQCQQPLAGRHLAQVTSAPANSTAAKEVPDEMQPPTRRIRVLAEIERVKIRERAKPLLAHARLPFG